jgi:anthranilate synthase
MFVRVEGRDVETCPIAGTIARGADPLEDSEQIRRLLASEKDEAELTMCTDVDRNDKSRVCEPGSVEVIGRRQIEMYSRLIHTVDHVKGRLREGFDAWDAFLTHLWAVTVTGAPKLWAMQFIEDHESTSRRWYGGAVGFFTFDGTMNTGLTLRTLRWKDGWSEVRVGATLLLDSDPDEEERETILKASALLDAIRRPTAPEEEARAHPHVGEHAPRLLFVDYQDSFVHTLAAYFREAGADVETRRAGFDPSLLDDQPWDLVVLSPGPGSPSDFDVAGMVGEVTKRGLPLFGVCLGLQGIVEYFGGDLGVLPNPLHGKPSTVEVVAPDSVVFDGLPPRFAAARYHSIHAERLPSSLRVTARTEDGVVMGVEHTELPVAAVQFHPESILTLAGDVGRRLVVNVVERLASVTRPAAPR